jgi:creatinine amidohydrolase
MSRPADTLPHSDASGDPPPPKRPSPGILAEASLEDVRNWKPRVAVLPLGATEPHNLHLPYGTDSLEAELIASRACQAAWEQGGRPVLLPTLPYGTESNLQAFPLAMNLQPTTLFRVIQDLVDSLQNSGIEYLLLLNSHGGNDLKPLLRELYGQTKVQLLLCNWFHMISDVAAELIEHPDDHAGEVETSLILSCRPDLVRTNADGEFQADAGQRRPFRLEALRQGWVSVTRPWHLLTTNSGSGNPHRATAAKGEQLLEAMTDRLAPLLVSLSHESPDAWFPFQPESDG